MSEKKPLEYNDRLNKLRTLIEQGINPYPARTERQISIEKLLAQFEDFTQTKTTIAGRLISIRTHGGSAFANLADESGTIQIYLKKDELGNEAYQNFTDYIDVGDFIEAAGKTFLTKKGERSLLI